MSRPLSPKEVLYWNGFSSQFLRNIVEYIKWIAVEPIWRAYRDFGTRIAIIAGLCVFGIFYLAITIPLSMFASVLSLVGVMEVGPIVTGRYTPAIILAVIAAGFGGYHSYHRGQTRIMLHQYSQNPSLENATKAYEYLDDEDPVVRARAAEAVADRIVNNPDEFVHDGMRSTAEEVAAQLAGLLSDDNDHVQLAGIESLASLSRLYQDVAIQYREDVYELLLHSHRSIQIPAISTVGHMAVADPTLSDEIIDMLEAVCEDSDSKVRKAAAMACSNICTDRAKKQIRKLAEDSDPEVRTAATKILDALDRGQQPDFTGEVFSLDE